MFSIQHSLYIFLIIHSSRMHLPDHMAKRLDVTHKTIRLKIFQEPNCFRIVKYSALNSAQCVALYVPTSTKGLTKCEENNGRFPNCTVFLNSRMSITHQKVWHSFARESILGIMSCQFWGFCLQSPEKIYSPVIDTMICLTNPPPTPPPHSRQEHVLQSGACSFLAFCYFFGPLPWHMEVPRLAV